MSIVSCTVRTALEMVDTITIKYFLVMTKKLLRLRAIQVIRKTTFHLSIDVLVKLQPSHSAARRLTSLLDYFCWKIWKMKDFEYTCTHRLIQNKLHREP